MSTASALMYSGASGEAYAPSVISSSCGSANWFAVFTFSRHEKQVQAQCAQKQIECFLPTYFTRHRWKNRCFVNLELPLFPNYLFVRIDPRERVHVLKNPGVISIVSSGRDLLPISDSEISALRAGLLAHRMSPHPGAEIGERVRITTGPMCGAEGILERHKNELRVILRLDMLARSVCVEVGSCEIEPTREVLDVGGLRSISA